MSDANSTSSISDRLPIANMELVRGIPSLVRKQFKSAQESGDLIFYSTRVTILRCNGLPVSVLVKLFPSVQYLMLALQFQLRFSPALANKPKSNNSANSKPVDPFESPPRGLYITDVGDAHYLVLNKFPVIPDHFILATKKFKNQPDLLEEDDIAAAYQCLQMYKDEGEELFGFFNSGEHSGASQPHRHIQFLPVESMRSGVEPGVRWDVLVDSLVKDQPELPFKYFAATIPDASTAKQLHNIYKELYEKACQLCGINKSEITTESLISYNLGLTDKSIVLCPRRSEGTKIETSQGELIGPIALNGTVLGGTLLVKTRTEWDALKADSTLR